MRERLSGSPEAQEKCTPTAAGQPSGEKEKMSLFLPKERLQIGLRLLLGTTKGDRRSNILGSLAADLNGKVTVQMRGETRNKTPPQCLQRQ